MIVLLTLLSLQDAALDPLYKFKPGTSWVYKRLEGGVERKVEAKVVEEADGRVKLDWRELNIDATPHSKSTVTWFVKDGVLRAEARLEDGGAFELPMFKAGAKKDEAWTNAEGESTYLGTAEVVVPAGTYKDAHHVRLNLGTADAPAHVNIHLAPKVGLVKLTVSSTEGPNSFELVEFKEAK